ncbi:MBL fold metallo-hydrolase [Streptomyces sp. XM4011]|uniref:MBL fold metallo-hydrolase n=1 Tax=Streptomyces TaxID=1883 RepID=UPI001FFACA7A|nr:MBL fold metallo-hydrolase [Streptomyces sp. XM4011]MCK1813203.1 MBL fold metallo-hydrolase [Streptomyces sp. XM4011]
MPRPTSDQDLVHARPDLQIEPLVHQYYAWLHLVSPAPAAMNFTKLHGPLLTAFGQAPRLHRTSALDPRLRGGMFVNLPEDAVAATAALAERIAGPDSPSARLSGAIDHLTGLAEERADGFDLSPLYAEIPEPLRGYVELAYDMNDHPQLRFFEHMLYRSPYYDESAQSIDLAVHTDDERPFTMTTPRLPGPGHTQVTLPLRDRRIDDLFASETGPRKFGELREALGITAEGREEFARLFTTEPPPPRPAASHDTRVRYLGHACVAVESAGVTVVTDPFLAGVPGPERYTQADLPDVIDYVLITHGHQDHLELGTLLRLRHRIGTIVVPKAAGGTLPDPSLKLCLKALGFDQVVEAEPGDVLEADGVRIVVCPFMGEHCDLDISAKVTYGVRTADRTLYFAADNRGLEPVMFANIRELLGPVDVAFLGMECDGAPLQWLYGPLFSRRLSSRKSRSRKLNGCNAAEARTMVEGLGARSAYVYAMGREPWLGFVMATNYTEDSYQLAQVDEFLRSCHARGLRAGELQGRADIPLDL